MVLAPVPVRSSSEEEAAVVHFFGPIRTEAEE
jgi:hypothetical protein